MIWTVPFGLELGLPASMSDSSIQDLSAVHIDAALQACSLAIAGAYLKSLSTPAIVALVGPQCPGTEVDLEVMNNILACLFPLSLSISRL